MHRNVQNASRPNAMGSKRAINTKKLDEALRVAAESPECDPQEVAQLLADGANVNSTGKDGYTPLHLAAEAYHPGDDKVDCLRVLLENGANIEARTRGRPLVGWTPLMLAVVYGRLAQVERLLKAGANPNAMIDGTSVLKLAAGSIATPVEVVSRLLAAGADVNAIFEDGYTVLHTAAIGDWEAADDEGEGYKILQLLVQSGADTNARVRNKWYPGWTPLMFAASEGSAAQVECLLQADVDPHVVDDRGRTALMVAITQGWETEAKVNHLIAAGTDLHHRDEDGLTAMNYARLHVEMWKATFSSKNSGGEDAGSPETRLAFLEESRRVLNALITAEKDTNRSL